MTSKLVAEASKLVKLGDKFLSQNGQKKFNEEAHRLLVKARLHEHYDYQELVSAAFQSFKHLQNFRPHEFSDLPLTIARGKHCFIDIYFWRRRPTVIHNHHFCGAFQCLEGSNVDLEYSFSLEKKFGRYHGLGALEQRGVRELKKGDIAQIDLLDKFIHQNHHQADLTVNLCFRTSELQKKHLSNFLYSGLKFEKDPVALDRVDRLFAFAGIEKVRPKELKLDLSDAFFFVLLKHGSSTQNPRLLELEKFFVEKIQREAGVDIQDHLLIHDEHIEVLQNTYN